MFLQRRIDLSSVPKDLDHWVRLNCGFSLESTLVGGSPGQLERGGVLKKSGAEAPLKYSHFGRFWPVGLWSLHRQRKVVAVLLADVMGAGTHHSEGATSHSIGVCSMGTIMAWLLSLFPV